MAEAGYKNWLGVINRNKLTNKSCAYLEPSATEDVLPQTAPHPIIFVVNFLYYYKYYYSLM